MADADHWELDPAFSMAKKASETSTGTAAYFSYDEEGAHIGSVENDPNAGLNVLIKSDGLYIRYDTTVLATYGSNIVSLGENNADSILKFNGGLGLLKYYDLAKQIFLQGPNGAVLTYTPDDGSVPYDGIGIVHNKLDGTSQAIIRAASIECPGKTEDFTYQLSCSQLTASQPSVTMTSQIVKSGNIIYMMIANAALNTVINHWSTFSSTLANISANHKLAGAYQVISVPYSANGQQYGNLFIKADNNGVLGNAWWLFLPGASTALSSGTEITISAVWHII